MGFATLSVVTQPVVEPVSADDAAVHLRLDTIDPAVPAYITAARAWAEQYLNRALITQTLRYTLSPSQPPAISLGGIVNPIIFVTPLNWWPVYGMPINLPMSPVQSVTSVSQRAPDGTITTLDGSTAYYADTSNEPARIILRGIGQPLYSDLSVEYVAGYGDAGTAVPTPILQAIKLLLGFFYEHRGDDDGGEPSPAVRMLLNPYRQVTFG